ncbi:AP2 domain-containing protein [Pseudogracilibacillus auburnensis]|uniref:AP2 domain-containing protein n=1 Tax=Pseudogracilibacillus auburnensis TaxID=1494959 RepID=UPI001A96A70D|nr:AP2 domain-containing protein [Pseudogracilibacillus auburnensis]MBO1003154.1 hypothetical protein [Pseudogracilibacillus auburnensis]
MKNDYEIRGDYTAIFLKKRSGEVLECLIDTEMLGRVSVHPNTWYSWKDPKSKTTYARADIQRNKKRKSVFLHKYLIGNTGDKVIDHINNDGLDNRFKNLRVIKQYENLQNRRGANENSKSGLRNVSWCNTRGKWFVQIRVNNKKKTIGLFDSLVEVNIAAIKARKNTMKYCKDNTKKKG